MTVSLKRVSYQQATEVNEGKKLIGLEIMKISNINHIKPESIPTLRYFNFIFVRKKFTCTL